MGGAHKPKNGSQVGQGRPRHTLPIPNPFLGKGLAGRSRRAADAALLVYCKG